MIKVKLAEKNTVDGICRIGGDQLLAEINHLFLRGGVRPIRPADTIVPIISINNLEAQLQYALQVLPNMNTVDEHLVSFAQQALAMYYEELHKVELTQAQKESNIEQAPVKAAVKAETECKEVYLTNNVMSGNHLLRSETMVKAALEGDTKPEKPNASVIAREVVNRYNFRLYLNGIYFWDGRYKLVSSPDIRRLLNDKYRREAERIGFAKFYDQVIEFILCESNLVVDSTAFDAITYLIAFRNGYLDTRSMTFHAPDPRLFFTSNINLDFAYGPCECPSFDRYLAEIMGGDQAMISRIWETIGLTLSNDLNRKALFVFQGVTNSSKSTLIKFIASLFEEQLSTALSVDDMDGKFALTDIIGKAMCMDTELAATPLRAGSVKKLKQLTSADPVNTDIKYKDRVSFTSRAKIFLATNHLFQIDHKDEAFMKRIVATPFYYEIPLERFNPEIVRQFDREKLAIAKKAITHYCGLRGRKYVFSGNYQINEMPALLGNSKAVVQILADRDDLIRAFLNECCFLTTMDECETTEDIHKAYTAFCERNKAYPVSQKTLTLLLKEILCSKVEPTKRRVITGQSAKSVLLGIKLKGGVKSEGRQE